MDLETKLKVLATNLKGGTYSCIARLSLESESQVQSMFQNTHQLEWVMRSTLQCLHNTQQLNSRDRWVPSEECQVQRFVCKANCFAVSGVSSVREASIHPRTS